MGNDRNLDVRVAGLVLGMLTLALLLTSSSMRLKAQELPKPNIVFILTDDMDAGNLRYMPTVQAQLVEKGTTFRRGILTLTQCCPSRATMLRGQYAHNHDIGDDADRVNGADDFRRLGLERSTVATWLDSVGYETALIGKYLNGYDNLSVPRGWDEWHASVDQDVWAKCLNDNGTKRCYEEQHPDSVLANKAATFIRANERSSAPLFLWLSFNAPHAPAPYEPQDHDKFTDITLPKSPSFNEKDVSDKPAWVRSKPRLTLEEIKDMRDFHRDRLRSLQTVDRAVGRLIDALRDTRRLDKTYIAFWTDNGYHMGEHRLHVSFPSNKSTPYMEDTEVPLVVRGPRVQRAKTQKLVLNTDIAPTFAHLARVQPPDFVDGRSFVPLLRGKSPPWRTTALIENRYSGLLDRPAYAGMVTKDTAYVEYDSGEKELYDLVADSYQLDNIYGEADPALKEALATRLEALRSCAGQACKAAEDGPAP